MVSGVASRRQAEGLPPIARAGQGWSTAQITRSARLAGRVTLVRLTAQSWQISGETPDEPSLPRLLSRLRTPRRYTIASWSGTAAALKGRPPKARRRPPDSADATRKARAENHQGGTTR